MSLITKYEFEAPEEGIKLLILAAVHGNETAGTKAEWLHLKKAF